MASVFVMLVRRSSANLSVGGKILLQNAGSLYFSK
jgi:hypothetical protein